MCRKMADGNLVQVQILLRNTEYPHRLANLSFQDVAVPPIRYGGLTWGEAGVMDLSPLLH
jgi:hypothetical protein